MQNHPKIDFKNMDPSDFITARIEERAGRLSRFFDRIIDCHVTVEAPHRHHQRGNLYCIHVVVQVPGTQIVVNRDRGQDHAHKDVYVAIRDAFDAVERQLAAHAERCRGEVKVHEPPLQGRIARLFPGDGYGFVQLTDGSEVYFHRNSVVAARFEELAIGQPVRLAIADGESEAGPQVTTLRPIHHMQFTP
jgi:ribosomal subunit interface protein